MNAAELLANTLSAGACRVFQIASFAPSRSCAPLIVIAPLFRVQMPTRVRMRPRNLRMHPGKTTCVLSRLLSSLLKAQADRGNLFALVW